MLDWMFTFEGWLGLATLTLLEIVLGIDNLVFLSIASARLPQRQQASAQRIGLLGALVLRIVMLSMLVWLTKLAHPITMIGDFELTWRDVIMLLGGLFLLYKGTVEIHREVEGNGDGHGPKGGGSSYWSVIALIMVIDFVFALDSIITAVGMTDHIFIMVAANVIAIGIMLAAASTVSDFIQRHPTVKVLALAFILLVGVALVGEGLHFHIPRGYLYFAIAFSLGVEFINMLVRRRRAAEGQSSAEKG